MYWRVNKTVPVTNCIAWPYFQIKNQPILVYVRDLSISILILSPGTNWKCPFTSLYPTLLVGFYIF